MALKEQVAGWGDEQRADKAEAGPVRTASHPASEPTGGYQHEDTRILSPLDITSAKR